MPRRRCELSVPASNYKMIAKAAGLTVDEVLLDLEDSVVPEARPEARQNIIKAAQELDWSGKTLAFRINPVSSQWFYADLLTVVEAVGDKIGAVILPKVERADEVATVAYLLQAVEAEKGWQPIAIEAQIETAQAMQAVELIAQSAPGRLVSLIFGPGDYAASIGATGLTVGGQTEGYPGHMWHYALSRILVAARANNLDAIDGPYAAFKDPDGLATSAKLTALMGYDGKWAIHPNQIEPIQAAFTPPSEALTRARRIIEANAASHSTDRRGAFMLDNEMIDAATVAMAKRTIAKDER